MQWFLIDTQHSFFHQKSDAFFSVFVRPWKMNNKATYWPQKYLWLENENRWAFKCVWCPFTIPNDQIAKQKHFCYKSLRLCAVYYTVRSRDSTPHSYGPKRPRISACEVHKRTGVAKTFRASIKTSQLSLASLIILQILCFDFCWIALVFIFSIAYIYVDHERVVDVLMTFCGIRVCFSWLNFF